MSADLLIKEDIVFGERVEAIALCSKVEVLQNLSTTGSYREVYYLSGKEGAFVSGVIFKANTVEKVDVEIFTDAPVLVAGTVGEYRGVKQIHIDSISPLSDIIDKNELLAKMVDTRILDDINDILYEQGSMYSFTDMHLAPAEGLEEAGAGTYSVRLLKFLQIGRIHYPELIKEYISIISVLSKYYLNTEGTLENRFDLMMVANSPLTRALLFSYREYPEYEEFVKLHHLILKPRGCILEILDSSFINYNSGGSSIPWG